MKAGIQRYRVYGLRRRDPKGEVILYADHLATVKTLRSEVVELAQRQAKQERELAELIATLPGARPTPKHPKRRKRTKKAIAGRGATIHRGSDWGRGGFKP